MNQPTTPIPKFIKTNLGTYWRAMETEYFIYYCNFQESDDNATVIMYRKDGFELVCNNYHATNDMMGVWEDKSFTWMSNKMKYNYRLHLEAMEKYKEFEKEIVTPF